MKLGTTSALLKTTCDAGQGQSGSPIFYYYDDSYEYSGQSHYIIGLYTHLAPNGSWGGGPTVGQFRNFALSHLEP